MKKKKILYSVLSLFLTFCFVTELSAQQVRRIIVGRIEGKDTLVWSEKVFNKKGELLVNHYINDNKTDLEAVQDIRKGNSIKEVKAYDVQGRVISIQRTGHGSLEDTLVTTYTYMADKTICMEKSKNYIGVVVDSFNRDGQLVNKKLKATGAADREVLWIRNTQYFYNGKLCSRKEETQVVDVMQSMVDGKTAITEYFYDDKDSLIKYEVVNLFGEPFTMEIKYDPVSHLRVEYVEKDLDGVIFLKITYKYDQQNQLIEKKEMQYYGTCPDPVWMFVNTYEYKDRKIVSETVSTTSRVPCENKVSQEKVVRYNYFYQYW